MSGFEVYRMYLALKQHFNRDNYDYIKYNGKVSASESAFEQRLDRYFFKKLANKLDSKEILNYFIANFIANPKGYIKSFSTDTYEQWKVNQDSFTYKFKEDVCYLLEDSNDNFDKIFEVDRGKHPILLKRYFSGDIAIETLVVFESCLGYVNRFDKKLTDPVWKDARQKVLKYKPFLNVDCKKYKSVILDTIRAKV